jgi:hypothetical protein
MIQNEKDTKLTAHEVLVYQDVSDSLIKTHNSWSGFSLKMSLIKAEKIYTNKWKSH